MAFRLRGLADGLRESSGRPKVTEAVHFVQSGWQRRRIALIDTWLRPQGPARLELTQLGRRVRITEPLQAELTDRLF